MSASQRFVKLVTPLVAAAGVRSVVQALKRVASLIGVVLLTRRAGVEVAGGVFLGIAVGAVVAPLVNRGLSQTMLREVGGLKPDQVDLRRELYLVGRKKVLLSSALGVLVVALAEWLLTSETGGIWTLGALLGGAVAVSDLGANYLRAIHRRMRPEVVEAAVPLIFVAAILVLRQRWLDVWVLLWLRFALEAAAAMVLGRLDTADTPGRVERAGRIGRLTRSDYGPLWLTMIAWLALGQLDVLFLGILRDRAAVGIYVPVLRTCEVLIFPYVVLNPYITALAAGARSKGELRAAATVYQRSAAAALVLISPVAAVLLAQPDLVIEFLYGVDDPSVPGLVRIIVVGFLAFLCVGPAPGIAYGMGSPSAIRNAAVQVIATMVFSTVIGVAIAGVEGAAVATSVSFLVMGLSAWSILRRAGLRVPLPGVAMMPVAIVLAAGAGMSVAPSSIASAVVAGIVALAATAAIFLALRSREIRGRP